MAEGSMKEYTHNTISCEIVPTANKLYNQLITVMHLRCNQFDSQLIATLFHFACALPARTGFFFLSSLRSTFAQMKCNNYIWVVFDVRKRRSNL
jgi:hypothetical protein